ncbi:hypothetical protein [Pleomorphomonas sp. PLEO]|uniref:hypothetical protein n=1 Tax=Pleomorphomonas sp. PLEO TaxID=3239306 RepID=UPI00351F0394
MSILSGTANAEGAISAGIYKDGKLLIEEPAADEPSSKPATNPDSKDSKPSGHHRGDSIDDGHEGG